MPSALRLHDREQAERTRAIGFVDPQENRQIESVIDSSYEISCADARILPRNGYFEFDAQPARITE
jgi:hypothetical protein